MNLGTLGYKKNTVLQYCNSLVMSYSNSQKAMNQGYVGNTLAGTSGSWVAARSGDLAIGVRGYLMPPSAFVLVDFITCRSYES